MLGPIYRVAFLLCLAPGDWHTYIMTTILVVAACWMQGIPLMHCHESMEVHAGLAWAQSGGSGSSGNGASYTTDNGASPSNNPPTTPIAGVTRASVSPALNPKFFTKACLMAISRLIALHRPDAGFIALYNVNSAQAGTLMSPWDGLCDCDQSLCGG